MAEMVKVVLLDRFNKKVAGDVVEVRPADAKLLKALGKARDYVSPVQERMTEKLPIVPETNESEQSTVVEEESSIALNTRVSYRRRDMKPEKEE